MNRTLAILAAAAPLLAGCAGYNLYEVRLEPAPDGIRRTFTGWREPGFGDRPATDARSAAGENRRLPDAELERLAKLFPERITQGREIKQSFSGTFQNELPDDVGGVGSYRRIDTPLGSAHWYVERFRGAVDPDAELYARRAAADRLADLAVGWFDEQMRDSTHHVAVRRFLHQEFRQDLRNVVAHLWNTYRPSKPAKDDRDAKSFPGPLAGVVAYLTERGYFEPHGAASIARYLDDGQVQFAEVRRLLARKSGLAPSEADAAFPFLVDLEAVGLSLAEYLRKTPEFEGLRKSWKPDPEKPEVTGPDPLEVVGEVAKQAFEIAFLLDRDELLLSLAVPHKPHLTNGTYNPLEGVVTWHAELPTRREMPLTCQAVWAVPDEKVQTEIYGKIRLDGEKLATFAVLFSSLPGERQREFADYVAAARRDDAVRNRPGGFRFAEPLDESTRNLEARIGKLLVQ